MQKYGQNLSQSILHCAIWWIENGSEFVFAAILKTGFSNRAESSIKCPVHSLYIYVHSFLPKKHWSSVSNHFKFHTQWFQSILDHILKFENNWMILSWKILTLKLDNSWFRHVRSQATRKLPGTYSPLNTGWNYL